MAAIHTTLRLDPSAVLPVLDQLTDIARRRMSVPLFFEELVELRRALPDALETLRVDSDGGAASTGDVLLALQFRQFFLDRAAALFALDRDFDVHGPCLSDGVERGN